MRTPRIPITADSSDERTVREVRRELREHLNATGKVTACACCGQLVKRTGYRITAIMAKQLDSLIGGPKTSRELEPMGGRAHPKLAYWDLATFDEDKKLWSITPTGESFVRGEIVLRRSVWVFNNCVVGYAGADVSFAECASHWRTKIDKAIEDVDDSAFI